MPPQHQYDIREGRWISEPSFPPPKEHSQLTRLYPNHTSLQAQYSEESKVSILGDQTHGMQFGAFVAFGGAGESPIDQRMDDGKALTFTSEPMTDAMDVVGFPELTVSLSVDKPQAFIAVRLCDIAPTGASTLVSYGVLNLTHRDSHEHPSAVTPDQKYTVKVQLNPIAHTLKAGHCWRLAISPTFFPVVWSSPEAVTMTVYTGDDTFLSLPVRPRRDAEDDLLPDFSEPEHTPYLPHEVIKPYPTKRSVEYDAISGITTLTDTHYTSDRIRLLGDGLEFETYCEDKHIIQRDDPLTAESTCKHRSLFRRGDWSVRIEAQATLTGDRTHFHLANQVDAYEGKVKVFTKTWHKSIPRDFI